jgi:hypothetical protein
MATKQRDDSVRSMQLDRLIVEQEMKVERLERKLDDERRVLQELRAAANGKEPRDA